MSKLSDPTAKFRDPELGRFLIQRVNKMAGELAAKKGRKILLMEVCGTHTFAISRTGLRDMLSDYLDLRSGPGCPVCVTHQRDIDQMIALAALPGVTVATFGDMIRVPGSNGSLEQAQADGAKVEVFYSPADAVEKAIRHPERQYVFLGVGFETTAPVIALAIQEAAGKDVRNFSVFPAHKKVLPILRALLTDPDLAIDGFLLPGHVSTILGRQAYDFMAAEHGIPAAIAGFEPVDILTAIMAVLELLATGRPAVVNSYQRAVREEGNPVAQTLLARTFRD
ncbi:MAG: hydrogenase formation protein HypD, partial [Heliobacteriaceae bacterium]|nr:hydrogenase formation protein HypD [Heliobacteriaceae bacterium]